MERWGVISGIPSGFGTCGVVDFMDHGTAANHFRLPHTELIYLDSATRLL